MQIVLNESLTVASKLTTGQLDILSLIFMLKYSIRYDLTSLLSLKEYLNNTILPFASKLTKENAHFQHLEYAGCGGISLGNRSLESIFLTNYPGLFSKGFTNEEAENLVSDPQKQLGIFTPCLHNEKLLQVSAVNYDVIKRICKENKLTEQVESQVIELQKNNIMTDEEVKLYLVKLVPNMEILFDHWENSSLKNMTLTSVGIALAHANIRRMINDSIDLSIWIK